MFIHILVFGLWNRIVLLVDINIPEAYTPYICRVKVGYVHSKESNQIKWEQCTINVTTNSPCNIHRTAVSRSSHRAPFPVVQTSLYYHLLCTICETHLFYNLSHSHSTHFDPKMDEVAFFKTFAYANKALKSWKPIPVMIKYTWNLRFFS
jgi:hypothetical protein